MLKPHISAKRDQLPVRLFPCPAFCLFSAGDQFAVFFLYIHKLNFSVIRLGGLAHRLEDALCTRQRRQQEIALLGELVDWHSGLTHKYQIAGKASHVCLAVYRHNASQNGYNRIVDIGNAHHRWDHRCRVALCACPRFAEAFVFPAERFQVFSLMIEHLDNLLPADHLLDITVQIAQAFLLLLEICLAAFPAVTDIQEHTDIAHNRNDRQPPVEHK